VIAERDSAIAEALAYVDDCLPPGDRRDFERKMASDRKVADRVEVWLAQNEAIRSAFRDTERRIGRASVASRDFSGRPPDLDGAARIVGEMRRVRLTGAHPASAEKVRKTATRANLASLAFVRCLRLGLIAFAALLIVGATGGPDPRERAPHFADAAIAAYRTYVGNRRQAVEFVTSDAKALERWFSPQFFRQIDIPDLAGAGFALVGGRMTPGAEGPAAFALYVNAEGERIGLMVEPFESPETMKPIFRSTAELSAVSIAARALSALTVVGPEATPRLIELAGVAAASSASR